MTKNNLFPENESAPVTKQPYEKPAFRYEKVFVTTALSCGKIGATSAACAASPKVS
jgi:hypothetical protein